MIHILQNIFVCPFYLKLLSCPFSQPRQPPLIDTYVNALTFMSLFEQGIFDVLP